MKRPPLLPRDRHRSLPMSIVPYLSQSPLTVEVVSENFTWPRLKSSSSNEPLFVSPRPTLPLTNQPGPQFLRPCSSSACVLTSSYVSTEVGLPSEGTRPCALWLRVLLPSLNQ